MIVGLCKKQPKTTAAKGEVEVNAGIRRREYGISVYVTFN